VREIETKGKGTGSAEQIATQARVAARIVARSRSTARERALREVAARLLTAAPRILEANAKDVAAARAGGMAAALVDRLLLDEARLRAMGAALEEVAAQPDPIGAIEALERRPNGLQVGRMRVPLGVILMIYESRPNVTTDAFGLCLRAGNAVILRGGSEAQHTNAALGAAIAAGLEAAGLPAHAAQIVPPDRAALGDLLAREQEIDLCIPRGGEGLIRFVAEHARMPVIKHYRGVCHVYVDAAADPEMALAICENAKAQRPGTCNACETILVHQAIADAFLPRLRERLAARGVEIREGEDAWGVEYYDLIVGLRVVPSLEAAIAHIEKYGSDHTEAIVSRDYAVARRFVDECGSSTVIVNASTRFADGGQLGLGAEIGISTTRLHAYGPMGARELTTTKFVVFGDGQLRT
jgi:glutamate-5-semialdehyde dehydrogenase